MTTSREDKWLTAPIDARGYIDFREPKPTTPNAIAGPSVEEAVGRPWTPFEEALERLLGGVIIDTDLALVLETEARCARAEAALSSLQAELRAVVKVLTAYLTKPADQENLGDIMDLASLHARLQTLTGVNTDG